MSDEVTPLMPVVLNPAQQRAAKSYKTNSYQGLPERELMVRIFQKLINHLYMARDAHRAGDLELMLEQNSKAIHIIDVLRGEMMGSDALRDPEASGPARMLINFYGNLLIRIANVLQKKPVEDEFNAIIEEIKPVYQAWVPPKPEEAASSEASPLSVSTDG